MLDWMLSVVWSWTNDTFMRRKKNLFGNPGMSLLEKERGSDHLQEGCLSVTADQQLSGE